METLICVIQYNCFNGAPDVMIVIANIVSFSFTKYNDLITYEFVMFLVFLSVGVVVVVVVDICLVWFVLNKRVTSI